MLIRALLLLASITAFGLAPLLTPPFTGYDPAQFPVPVDRPAIQPAGYAFAIWSLIYLWLIFHAVFGLWTRAKDPAWDRVRLPLAAAAVIGAAWLSIAGASAIWGTLTIWPMMMAALIAFLRADPDQDRWLLSGAPAILAGWLTAAAAVSTGVTLSGYGWLLDTAAALTMLALVLAIAVPVQRARPGMPVYGLTVIWALVGVIVANMETGRLVAIAAAGGIVVMAATLLLSRRA